MPQISSLAATRLDTGNYTIGTKEFGGSSVFRALTVRPGAGCEGGQQLLVDAPRRGSRGRSGVGHEAAGLRVVRPDRGRVNGGATRRTARLIPSGGARVKMRDVSPPPPPPHTHTHFFEKFSDFLGIRKSIMGESAHHAPPILFGLALHLSRRRQQQPKEG